MVTSHDTKRSRLVAVVAAAALAVGALLGLAGVSQARRTHRDHRSDFATGRRVLRGQHGRHHRHHRKHRRAVRANDVPTTSPPAFDIHLTPTFDVGQAGWNFVIEENGDFGGSTGMGVIHPSTPLVSVSGSSRGGSHEWTTVAVTLPEVAAILVEGKIRVPTETLPGLPYGLRAARVTTPWEEPQDFPGSLASRPATPSVEALGANGEQLPQSTSRETRETPFQGTVHRWSYPSGPAQGSCELQAGHEAGLVAESGATLSDIRPYPGHIYANAFLPCDATLYSLHGHQLRAYLLLDAADPGSLPAVIPGTSSVPGIPSIYSGNSGFYGGPTDLVAERSGDAWLAVQGASESERMQLLEDLSATVQP